MKTDERKRLIEQVSLQIAELEKTISDNQPLAIKKQEQSDDASANMDLTIQGYVNDKLMQDHQAELSELRQCLLWLDSDNAGNCESCGSDIPIARLMAALGSRLCISCAEKTALRNKF